MAFSPEHIRTRDFSLASPGYDKAEVDAFLQEIAQQISASQTDTGTVDQRAMSAVERLERLADRFEGSVVDPAKDHPAASNTRSSSPAPASPAPSSAAAVTRSPVTPVTPTPPVAPAPVAAEAAPKSAAPAPAPAPAAPAPEPVAQAAATPQSAAPAGDQSLPVAEQLDLAKSLLDGVLDDVMGSLRPEH